ncbi:MAG: hypothetical protein VB098_09625 [Petrimonas sp.]|nr:hypothetical protein [Petrimonas sp.]MEA4980134.1 hypothetical protein [Petrimonas sp.]MEA5063600.1 hypothetical protein [Petrimonas sp.]
MKRILIYLFCVSITLQSMPGQFLPLDYTTGSFALLPAVTSLFSDKTETDHSHFLLTDTPGKNIKEVQENNNSNNLKFVCDSAMDHLFSLFNCPNKTTLFVLATFSYLYGGNYFDIFAIEDKINNFILFYSEFFRIIQIGLPITKLIYPFHYFHRIPPQAIP